MNKMILFLLTLSTVIISCKKTVIDDNPNSSPTNLPSAFDEFDDDNTVIYLDGDEVVIETNGFPNHTTPYWSENHPLHIDPIVTTEQTMAPGIIDNWNGNYTLRAPLSPEKAANSTATGLGPIGISVTGAVIYNDQEGPNVPLLSAVVSLDYTGGHIGPSSYHYHLEPKAWSDDDANLIGIISDGFFIYGRKCHSTGTRPNNLDASGGHVSITQHNAEEQYHYHIIDELYLNQYYLLFPGLYQGTSNAIQ